MEKEDKLKLAITATTATIEKMGILSNMKLLKAFEPFNIMQMAIPQPLKPLNEFMPLPPLLKYGLQLERIFNEAVIMPIPTKQIDDFVQRVSNSVAEAENNFIYNLAIDELEKEKERTTELEQQVKEYEIALRIVLQTKSSPKLTKQPRLTLTPCITLSQIAKLHQTSTDLFESTLEQWRNLLSEEIKIFEKPIVSVSRYISDVRMLFYSLKEYKLIEANNYPSILEKSKAFSYNEKIITSKQLNKPTEYSCYPHIGNYELINKIIKEL